MARRLRTVAAGLLSLALGAVAPPAPAAPTQPDLTTRAERAALDLSAYTVRDPKAGYFDVAARRAWLRDVTSPILRQETERLALGMSCRAAMEQPVLNTAFALPSFYLHPETWDLASEPFFTFEDTVSHLAGHYVVTGDPYFADCLIDYLDRWAREDGFMNFVFDGDRLQAWFAVESSLFAAGFAVMAVEPHAETARPAALRRVLDWLNRAAQRHLSFRTDGASCCNNHFYRRALYATVIGILTGDDGLFRYGVSAVYSALQEAGPDGSLPREMKRQSRKIHYQNFATMYLVTIMQLVARQGYPIFDLRVDGRTIHDVVGFTLDILSDPISFQEKTGVVQNLWFMEDPQYFGWMEIYGARFPSQRISRFLRQRRPIYNRSAGGYLTLYLYRPSADEEETEVATLASGSFRFNEEYCEKHPKWRDERDTSWRIACESRLHGLRMGLDAESGVPDSLLDDPEPGR